MIVAVKGPKHLWREMRWEVLIMFLVSCGTYYLDKKVYDFQLDIPDAALGVFGLAITFFVIFRSNKVYDRWWEARIIWGAIVNDSRTWTMQVLSFINAKNAREPLDENALMALRKRLIYRHLAFINSLRMGLRREDDKDTLAQYIDEQELKELMLYANHPTHLNRKQAEEIEAFFGEGVEQGRYKVEMMDRLRAFYDEQGKCERIKNTPFPKHYTVLTDISVWGYAIIICFFIVGQFNFMLKTDLNWLTIIVATIVGTIIIALERLAKFHEDPFDLEVHDTPMSTLCRSIEIDLRQMLGETDVPKPLEPIDGVLN